MKALSIFFLIPMLGCSASEFKEATGLTQIQSANDATVLDSRAPVTETDDNQITSDKAAIAQTEAEEPVSVGGAYLTCISRGVTASQDGSGMSCSFRFASGAGPNANDGNTYQFTAKDPTNRPLPVQVFSAQPMYEPSDWYLLVDHAPDFASCIIQLDVIKDGVSVATASTTVPIVRGPSVALSIRSESSSMLLGGGSPAPDADFGNQIRYPTLSAEILLPSGSSEFQVQAVTLEKVGIALNSGDFLDVGSRFELWKGTQLVETWRLPLNTLAITYKTTAPLEAGTYKLKIIPGFNPTRVRDFDDFRIGSLKFVSSSPMAVGKFVSN